MSGVWPAERTRGLIGSGALIWRSLAPAAAHSIRYHRPVMDRGAFRRKLGERALRLPIWFHAVMLLLASGIPLYQWVTFSGLFRLWAEAEIRADGKYWAVYIYVMLVGAFVLADAIVTQAVAAFLPPPTDAQLAKRSAAFQRYEDAGVWMRRHRLWLVVLAAAVGGGIAGVQALMK